MTGSSTRKQYSVESTLNYIKKDTSMHQNEARWRTCAEVLDQATKRQEPPGSYSHLEHALVPLSDHDQHLLQPQEPMLRQKLPGLN